MQGGSLGGLFLVTAMVVVKEKSLSEVEISL